MQGRVTVSWKNKVEEYDSIYYKYYAQNRLGQLFDK